MQAIASMNPSMSNTHPIDTLAHLRADRLAGSARLDLRGCGLSELPQEIFTLAETLEVLDLSGNKLQALP